MPKYSVIIPTYNRAAYLQDALVSVWAQTYRDFEVIVCDDGSTDETPELLASWGKRVRVVHSDRAGCGGARNAAAAVATGEYLACLDSDDQWTPWTLECIDRAVTLSGPNCIVITSKEVLGANTFQTPTDMALQRFGTFLDCPLWVPHAASQFGAFPRELFLRVGGFWTIRAGNEDVDLLLRVGQDVRVTLVVRPVQLLYRRHAANVTKNIEFLYNGAVEIVRREQAGLYPGTPLQAAQRRRRLAQLLMRRCLAMRDLSQYRVGLKVFWHALPLLIRANEWAFLFSYPAFALCSLLMDRTLVSAHRRSLVDPRPAPVEVLPRVAQDTPSNQAST